MAQPRSGHFFWLLYVVLVSALGGFLFGFDSGVISEPSSARSASGGLPIGSVVKFP